MQLPALPDGLMLERTGARATVSLARADRRNALSAEIMRGLRDVALWLKNDIETHVVVLTGTPAGVGPLNQGDELVLELVGLSRSESRVL